MKTLSIKAAFLMLCMSTVGVCSKSSDVHTVQKLWQQTHRLIVMDKLLTGHNVIEAIVNDQMGFFIVDTAAITVLNNSTLDRYHIKHSGKINTQSAAGAGGAILIDYYPLNNMEVAALPIPINQIGATDLNAVTQGLFNATGTMVDGLLGQDVLTAMQAVIDVSKQHLYLLDIHQDEVDVLDEWSHPDFKALALQSLVFKQFNLNFLTIKVQINGVPGKLIIDSGASRTMLDSDMLSHFNLNATQQTFTSSSTGAGGSFKIQQIPVPNMVIGTLKSRQTHINHSDLSAVIDFVAIETGVHVDGVLGQDILLKHQAIIDVGKQLLYLRP